MGYFSKLKRIFTILRLWTISTAKKRAEYLKKKKIFGHIGNNVLIQTRKLPLYPNLVFIHDNVKIASNVEFITHDIIYKMLNDKFLAWGGQFIEKVGCIEILNNVFIGSNTTILYNIRIGNNVIIGAGSLVTNDIPDNCVYAGVPAKFICSFEDYVEKSRKYTEKFKSTINETWLNGVDEEIAKKAYEYFLKSREK